jgi:predicted transcriptional regulator
MKSILMSIQPYYAYLEMKGIKTIEVRKTKPKSKDWSGKVKVYVSQNKKSFNRIPKEDRVWFKQYVGKVAYEFVCDKVDTILCASTDHRYFSKCGTCLTEEEIGNYCNGNDIFGLHITDLKIYDEPRELGEFRKPCGDCIGKCTGEHYERCPWQTVTRPPQSWQYVGEVKK